MNDAHLIQVMRKGFDGEDPRTGMTPLDQLIQNVKHDPGTREFVREALPAIAAALGGAKEWHALAFLIVEARLQNQVAGDLIESRISNSAEITPEASIWAARCAIDLASVLTRPSLDRINSDAAKQSNPKEWLSVVSESCEWTTVEALFRDSPKSIKLNETNALDLLRTFKRACIKVGEDWNGAVSVYFENLDLGIALAVSERAEPLVGYTFFDRARKRGLVSEIVHVADRTFEQLFAGMAIVRANTMWSQQQAHLPIRAYANV